jgi:uncharacterized protein (TIGR03437 family)
MRKPFLLLAPIAFPTVVLSATLVVPNSNLPFPGNTSEAYPKGQQSIEFQEVLGVGQFHSNPITISAISFRAAPGSGPVNINVANLSVTLSTSPNFPNTMSSTFANNVGSDKVVVFSGSNVTLKDTGCPGGGLACPFDLTVVFQTPFVYSTSKGSLLIDMVYTNLNATSGALDSVSFNPPGGNLANVTGTAGSATGTLALQGPIVQFTYTTTAPMISGVVNVASNIPPNAPNYGLAQGSLFAVYGTNMGPADLAVAQLPLPTTAGLAGTTVNIVFNGTGISAPVFFTRSDVVVGVIPSDAPPGNSTLSLVYNGKVANVPITVMRSNFGISNVLIPYANNGIGVLNNAAVTFPNYQTVTATNTAKPGDVLTVWGTGLGATPNNGGDTNAPPAGNIGSAPQVFVGGVASPSVSYWGRAPGSIPGLDQINFRVPDGAPLGCNVSVVVQTSLNGNVVVSNAPTIALGTSDGGTCSDPLQVVPASALQVSSAKVLSLGIQQNINITGNSGGPASGTISGKAEIDVLKLSQAQFGMIAPQQNTAPTAGTCYVGINPTPSANGPFVPTFLDAGPTITLSPPSGSPIAVTDQNSPPGFYRQNLGNIDLAPNGTFTIPGGTWGFSNGSGGADIGQVSFNFPVPQPVMWTNRGSLIGAPITRTDGLTVKWSGGDANGYVDIQGYTQVNAPLSFPDQNGFYYVGFECAAAVSDGQFTIPPSILLAMPATPFGTLQVSTFSLPNVIGSAPGFDFAVATSQFQTQIPVSFK